MRDFCRRIGASLSLEAAGGPARGDLRLQLEWLERRELMTATATPQVEALAAAGVSGFNGTPSEIRTAYGFNNITFQNGASGTGAGETIAIVDAYGDSRIASDLAAFDAEFHIAPPPSLKVVNETGGAALPANNASWDMEISLDVEWAHAIAPGANILLVEANTAGLGDLLTAVNYARSAPGVAVVSMSWGASEFNGEQYYDSIFTTPAGHQGVTFVGSSGDSGAPGLWPGMSQNVLDVGGTTLDVTSSGAYATETAWSGSGGGLSRFESEPSYQRSVQNYGVRSGPDVSYDANPSTGFYVYDSVSGGSGWWIVGGTSAGAPQWSGLIAIADQGRAISGEASLNGANSQIYGLPSSDFHDVIGGSNGYAATAGYDLATGRGSPIANLVVAGLVGNPAPTTTRLVIGPMPLMSLYAATHNNDVTGGGDGDGNAYSGAVTPATPISTVPQLLAYNPLVNGTNVAGVVTASYQGPVTQAADLPLADLVASTLVRASGAGEVETASGPTDMLTPGLPATQAPSTTAGAIHSAAHDAAFAAGPAAVAVPDEAQLLSASGFELVAPVDLEAIWSDADFSNAPWSDVPVVAPAAAPVADPVDSQASLWMTAVVGLALGCTQGTAEERTRPARQPAADRRFRPRFSRN